MNDANVLQAMLHPTMQVNFLSRNISRKYLIIAEFSGIYDTYRISITYMTCIAELQFLVFLKGQLISEGNFGVSKVKDLKWDKKVKTHFHASLVIIHYSIYKFSLFC